MPAGEHDWRVRLIARLWRGPGWVRLLVAVPLALSGAALVNLSWGELRRHALLARHGTPVTAEVIDWRTSVPPRGDRTYDLRYRFRVPGRDGWFEMTDAPEFGFARRARIWATVPHATWERTRADPRLDVVYVPSDPTVNRPAIIGGSTGGVWFGLVLGSAFVVFAALMVVRGGRASPPAAAGRALPP